MQHHNGLLLAKGKDPVVPDQPTWFGSQQRMNIERRFKARYPLQLNVRYHTFGVTNPVSGVGRTVNFSSSGVLVESSEKVKEESRIKLTIEWPSLLNGTTPLQLVTFGRVVRTDGSRFAVALEHYQFRTMKRDPLAFAQAETAVANSATTAETPQVNSEARVADVVSLMAEFSSSDAGHPRAPKTQNPRL